MKRKRFAVEQIISMLREAQVHLSHEKSAEQLGWDLELTAQTYFPGKSAPEQRC